MYRLTRNHIRCLDTRVPILLAEQAGPYNPNDELPLTNGSCAAAFVKRHALGKPLPGDPGLVCDEGKDLKTECLKYIAGIRSAC